MLQSNAPPIFTTTPSSQEGKRPIPCGTVWVRPCLVFHRLVMGSCWGLKQKEMALFDQGLVIRQACIPQKVPFDPALFVVQGGRSFRGGGNSTHTLTHHQVTKGGWYALPAHCMHIFCWNPDWTPMDTHYLPIAQKMHQLTSHLENQIIAPLVLHEMLQLHSTTNGLCAA